MMMIQEAVLALAGSSTMRAEGIDENFAALFARNMENFDALPEGVRTKIADQFTAMAHELSYSESVARKHSEEKEKALATWLKSINLLLAMNKVWTK